MKIDPTTCIACGSCAAYCPMGCIMEDEEAFVIDWDECVECGVCLRANACPVEAIYRSPECTAYPRSIRAAFSDPSVQFPELKQGGRGTEEMKTNDVTGKFRFGDLGITLEFGRPGTGTRLSEIEKAIQALVELGIPLLPANPIFFLLEDPAAGRMRQEVLGEKVLSAILEFKIQEAQLEEVVKALLPVVREADTTVSWGLVTRFESDGSLPVISRLENIGLAVRPNAKVNLGLGRPLIDDGGRR